MRKLFKKLVVFLVIAAVSIPTFAFAGIENYGSYYFWNGRGYYSYNQPKDQISIIFTNDTEGQAQSVNNEGGLAKALTQIKNIRSYYPDSYILDAGGYTPSETNYGATDKDGYELRLLSYLTVDATTLGNEELSGGKESLEKSLLAANKNKGDENLPVLACCNIDWDSMLGNDAEGKTAAKLKDAYKKVGGTDYTIIKKFNSEIAVFGVLGDAAAKKVKSTGIVISDPVTAAKATVDKIKSKEKNVDMIVCLSHSGSSNGGTALEESLANSLDNVDLIVAADTDAKIKSGKTVKDTLIVSTQAKAKTLGHIVLVKDKKGYKLESCEDVELGEYVYEDPTLVSLYNDHIKFIDKSYFGRFGFSFSDTFGKNNVNFTEIKDLGKVQDNDPFGRFIADSYRYTVKNKDKSDSNPIDVSFVAVGSLKATLGKGLVNTDDIFKLFDESVGKDGLAGSPMVSVYLSGAELRILAEVDASVAESNKDVRLYSTGLEYSYNPHRFSLNKISKIWLNKDGEKVDIKDKGLYRVVTDMNTLNIINEAHKAPFGLMDLVYKDSQGKTMSSLDEAIISVDNNQMKQWYAVASYMKNDGVSGNYQSVVESKILDDNKSIKAIFANPGKIFKVVALGTILGIALLILLIVLIASLVRRILGIPPKSKYRKIKSQNNEKPIFSHRKNKYRSRIKIRRK